MFIIFDKVYHIKKYMSSKNINKNEIFKEKTRNEIINYFTIDFFIYY